MGLAIKKNTLEAYHKAMRERLDKANFDVLSRVGEEAVIYARSLDTYTDRTTNLRNSIGYVILKDGIVVSGKFPGNSVAGKGVGQAYANKVAEMVTELSPKGWILIVVAGMDYAACVEAKGYDVLSGAGNMLKLKIAEILSQIKSELKK